MADFFFGCVLQLLKPLPLVCVSIVTCLVQMGPFNRTSNFGIEGNEEADIMAKQALRSAVINIHVPLSCAEGKSLYCTTYSLWQEYWDASNTGRHLYNIQNKVGTKSKTRSLKEIAEKKSLFLDWGLAILVWTPPSGRSESIVMGNVNSVLSRNSWACPYYLGFLWAPAKKTLLNCWKRKASF